MAQLVNNHISTIKNILKKTAHKIDIIFKRVEKCHFETINFTNIFAFAKI